MLSLPGMTLAWAINSGTVLAGTDGFTSMASGTQNLAQANLAAAKAIVQLQALQRAKDAAR